MAGNVQGGSERPSPAERAAARRQIRSMAKAGVLPRDQLGARLAAARSAPDQATLSHTQDPGWDPASAPRQASARGVLAATAAAAVLAGGGAAVFAAIAGDDAQSSGDVADPDGAVQVVLAEGPLTADSAAAALSEYLFTVSRGDWDQATSMWCTGLLASHSAADLRAQAAAEGGPLPAYRFGPAGEPVDGRSVMAFHLRWANREDGPFEAALVEEGGLVRFCGAGRVGGPHDAPLVPAP